MNLHHPSFWQKLFSTRLPCREPRTHSIYGLDWMRVRAATGAFLYRHRSPWLWLALFLATVSWGIVQSAPEVLADVAALERFQIKSEHLAIVARAPWVEALREYLPEPVLQPVGLPPCLSALDQTTVSWVAGGYRRHPWVEEVLQVRLIFPNQLQATLILRYPVALIAAEGAYYPVDRLGIALPGVLQTPVPWEVWFLPVLMGVQGAVVSPGQRWPDPAVREGTALACFLRRHGIPAWLPIVAMEITLPQANATTEEIVLITVHQTRILWGRPPGSHGVHLATQTRLEQLLLLRKLMEQVPQLRGIKTVDVRFGMPIVR